MSCSTLSQQSVRMSVSIGSLPEGFCPESMQDLGNAIAARLIVTPNQDFSSFAVGSIPPTSNVGPWLKDCLEWFFFNDSTASYVPMTKGFSNVQVFSTTGDFTVPNNIYRIKVEAWGGGGGGAGHSAAVTGGGGGGGGYGLKFFDVVPSQVIPLSVGVGGTPGAIGGNGGSGGATTFQSMTANGGAGGSVSGAGGVGGTGGTTTGADIDIKGQSGGSSITSGDVDLSASGGDSPNGGGGGRTVNSAGNNVGIVPGGGGAAGFNGGTVEVGGAGANGRIVVWY